MAHYSLLQLDHTHTHTKDYLFRIPFLNRIPSKRLDMLGEMSRFEILGPGTDVIREGEHGDKVYVVLFGNLVVTAFSGIDPTSNNRRKLVLAEMHIGECCAKPQAIQSRSI